MGWSSLIVNLESQRLSQQNGIMCMAQRFLKVSSPTSGDIFSLSWWLLKLRKKILCLLFHPRQSPKVSPNSASQVRFKCKCNLVIIALGRAEQKRTIFYAFLPQIMLFPSTYSWLPLSCCLLWGHARTDHKQGAGPFVGVSTPYNLCGSWVLVRPRSHKNSFSLLLVILVVSFPFETQRGGHLRVRQLPI